MSRPDGRQAAREVWGASPAGTQFAQGLQPGTREFFEAVVERRTRDEMPWLFDLVPFASFRGRSVLEIGCGAGYDALVFCRNGADYTGIDVTPENIERTRKHLEFYDQRPPLSVADAEDLPFLSGTFDVVFSNGVLHHVPDIRRALGEARRVLKPGGELWIVVYHRDSAFYWLNLWLYQHLLRGGSRTQPFKERLARIEYTTSDALPIVNVFSRGKARDLVRSSGFDIQRTWIRKLEADDLPAARLWQWVPREVLDRLGRWLGWYVIVHATARTGTESRLRLAVVREGDLVAAHPHARTMQAIEAEAHRGRLAREVFGYAEVKLFTRRLDVMSRPFATAALLRPLARRRLRLEDLEGNGLEVTWCELGRMASRFLRDGWTARRLRTDTEAGLARVAACDARRRLRDGGRPLYLRTDLWYGLEIRWVGRSCRRGGQRTRGGHREPSDPVDDGRDRHGPAGGRCSSRRAGARAAGFPGGNATCDGFHL